MLTHLKKFKVEYIIALFLYIFFPVIVHAAPSNYNVGVSVSVPPTTVVFNGYTSPSAFVYVEQNGSVLATGSASDTGSFHISIEYISSGIENYQLYSQDTEGLNSSIFNISDNILSDTINTVSDINLSPSIKYEESGNVFTISGMATPGSNLEIFMNTLLYKSTQSSISGVWSYSLTNLPSGKVTLSALDITESGIISNQSDIVSFDVSNTIVNTETIKVYSPTLVQNVSSSNSLHIVSSPLPNSKLQPPPVSVVSHVTKPVINPIVQAVPKYSEIENSPGEKYIEPISLAILILSSPLLLFFYMEDNIIYY